MPSYTSSSDVTYRDTPDQPWPRLIVIAAVLLSMALTGWELLARSMHHMPGSYYDMSSAWANERRKLDDSSDVRVVLAGSSRMLWAADLDIMEQELGARPIQLSLAGTSPGLFVEDIVDNTKFDGIILVGVTPFLFSRLSEGAFGGDALDRYHNEMPSQYTGSLIFKFLNDHFGFLDESFDLFALIDRYSDLPMRENSTDLMQEQWKLGDEFADRQTDMWPPVETVGSFDNQQMLNFWGDMAARPIKTPEEMAEMASKSVAFFAPLIEKLRARGGDIVFIRMPSDGDYLVRDLRDDYYNLTWKPMAEGFDAPTINSMDYPQLSSELDIPEWSHLSRESQDRWSHDIIPLLHQTFRDYRGFEIDDIIKAEGEGE